MEKSLRLKYEGSQYKVFRIEIFMFVKISTEHKTGGRESPVRQSESSGGKETSQTILTASASASAPA